MKKMTRIIYISAFFAVCALPLVLKPFAGDNGEIEKRELTPLPYLKTEIPSVPSQRGFLVRGRPLII
jgi:hypothetical protein